MNTAAGGRNMRQTMIARHGSEEKWREHMRKMGSEGGKKRTDLAKLNGELLGFAADPALASYAGRKGGKISRKSRG